MHKLSRLSGSGGAHLFGQSKAGRSLWAEIESKLFKLAKKSNLPPIDVENAVDKTLLCLLDAFESGNFPSDPLSWSFKTIGRFLRDLRRKRKQLVELNYKTEGKVEERKVLLPQDSPSVEDFWIWVAENQTQIKANLTSQQFKALNSTRGAHSMQIAARLTCLTKRDYKNHMDGVIKKLKKILGNFA
jgi:DNA-directed RNA polymerase specialized sigma24 family protein